MLYQTFIKVNSMGIESNRNSLIKIQYNNIEILAEVAPSNLSFEDFRKSILQACKIPKEEKSFIYLVENSELPEFSLEITKESYECIRQLCLTDDQYLVIKVMNLGTFLNKKLQTDNYKPSSSQFKTSDGFCLVDNYEVLQTTEQKPQPAYKKEFSGIFDIGTNLNKASDNPGAKDNEEKELDSPSIRLSKR